MSKIQDILWGMTEENHHAGVIHANYRNAGLDHETAGRNFSDMRKAYGKQLRTLIKRKSEKIVSKYSQCWGTQVSVYPMHSNDTGLTCPFISILWEGKHGRIDIKCYANTPEKVEEFLLQFEKIVIALSPQPKP